MHDPVGDRLEDRPHAVEVTAATTDEAEETAVPGVLGATNLSVLSTTGFAAGQSVTVGGQPGYTITAVGGAAATPTSLSAPVAVLLFLYLTALAILFGAELNTEIERMWPSAETQVLHLGDKRAA